MIQRFLSNVFFIFALFLGISLWGIWVVFNHPKEAIVSWDEGFHGGAALFLSESLRNNFSFRDYTYILNDFRNGIIWYPPLWLFVAAPLGAIFGPSLEIFRIGTLIFSISSILLITFFVKGVSDKKSAAVAGLSLAFIPVFIVYSHLMMREVPLLFGVSLSLLFFYRYLTKPTLSKLDYLLTVGAFSLGVLAKIIGIVLIFGTITGLGLTIFIFFKNSDIFKRFFSKGTLFFLGVAILSFLIYRQLVILVLNADPLLFHLEQTKQMSGDQSKLLLVLIKTTLNSLKLYTNDFSHMIPLTVLWFASLPAYILLKRSLLSYFLLIWVIVTYLSFTAVKPQAQQYLMSIFAPLSIATGLFWGEFLKYRSPFLRNSLFIIFISSIVWLGQLYLDKTETIIWRETITNQTEAVRYMVDQAKIGDRVISSGDGTRFLIRLLGDKKKLQTINGAAPVCPESVQDSTEWAILDYGPQNPIRLNVVSDDNFWMKQVSYENSIDGIHVFKNIRDTYNVTLESKGLIKTYCSRFLLPGKNIITVVATPVVKTPAPSSTSDLKISLKVNPLKILQELSLKEEELFQSSGKEEVYNIHVNQNKINQPTYLVFSIPKNITFTIRKIEIINEGKK